MTSKHIYVQTTNEVPYTPTADYHPATKKYVDDIAMNSGAGDMLRSVYDTDGDGVVDNAMALNGLPASDYVTQSQLGDVGYVKEEDLYGSTYNVKLQVGDKMPDNATRVLSVDTEMDINYYVIAVNTPEDSTQYLEDGDTIPNHLKGQDITAVIVETEDGEVPLGIGEVDIYIECQSEGVLDQNTPPELTATSPDGTMIGSDGWTGTGFVCTAANTKYAIKSSNMSNRIVGFNRFCLRFADVSGNNWKNWSPWLDIDGVTYEFFYSPARKLYEALIPATTETAEEIVSSIRWERAEPDVIRYGKISNMFSINSVVSDETETVYYNMYTDEASLRDYSGKYTDDDSKVAMAFSGGEITLPADNIPNNIIHKLFLALDINCDGEFKPAEVAAISRKVKSAAVFTVETIDNFA